MDVHVATNMTHDEIKSKYKEYLTLQALSKNTVQTVSNDTLSKELFWEKILPYLIAPIILIINMA